MSNLSHFIRTGKDASSNPAFLSAKIFAAKDEVDFWTGEHPDLSGMKVPPEARNQTLSTIQRTFGAVKSSLELKSPGRLSPEVSWSLLPGTHPATHSSKFPEAEIASW